MYCMEQSSPSRRNAGKLAANQREDMQVSSGYAKISEPDRKALASVHPPIQALRRTIRFTLGAPVPMALGRLAPGDPRRRPGMMTGTPKLQVVWAL